MTKHILFATVLLTLSACSAFSGGELNAPQHNRDARKEARGRLTGDDGLAVFSGGKRIDEAKGGSPIGVNSYLWRACLDTLSFMPLASADPFGGVITTDWYEDPKTPGERFKVNALILDRSLRADGVKITVFKQKAEKSGWRDQAVDGKLSRSLEDAILTRARQMKIAQGGK